MWQSKIKHEETWRDVIIYRCEYYNPDGMIWVRFSDDFFILFKEKENE